MSDFASFSVLRIYKNASGDSLRIDEVSISGSFVRKNTWRGRGGYQENPNLAPGSGGLPQGQSRWNFGPWLFHPSGQGRRVSTEQLITGGSRVVAEVEMIGGWTTIAAGPNYNSVTWRGGSIDMSDLPQVGATV